MNTERAPGEAADRPVVKALERWDIDPARSTLEFSLRHLIIQEIHGQFRRWGGTVFVDRADPSRSRVDVWIEVASLDTGSGERDAHVRSPEFLDVGRFPRARFYSTAVEPSGERLRVRGNLLLHGVSREVEVDVNVRGNAYDAHAVIDRQAFGLHWNQDLDVGGIVVGDRIDVRAKAETRHMPGGADDDRR